jgi:hypothetical protein
MKVQHLGFSITDIGDAVAGLDVDQVGSVRIAFVGPDGGELLSSWIPRNEVEALVGALNESLTLTHGRWAD